MYHPMFLPNFRSEKNEYFFVWGQGGQGSFKERRKYFVTFEMQCFWKAQGTVIVLVFFKTKFAEQIMVQKYHDKKKI